MNICFISLGCPKNLVDTETMIGLVSKNNRIVIDLNTADIAIVNTCGFLQSAKDEACEEIESLKLWKNSSRKIIITGCMVEEDKEILKKKFPFIDGYLNPGAVGNIVDLIQNLSSKNGPKEFHAANQQNLLFSENRILATPPHYAYLKVSEGCSNHCSYCKIPKLRGELTYKNPELILKEATKLVKNGVQELILTAQDLAAYSPNQNYQLPKLLKDLAMIHNLKWIRLMYCHPKNITPRLIQEINTNNKVVKYLDMPIQHINDKILNSMNRKTSKNYIMDLISQLRADIQGLKLRSTVIVGYPGENDDDFQELHNFLATIKFDHLGVFPYSNEPNTSSFNMRGQVKEETKQQRYETLMQLQQRISKNLNQKYLGQTLSVLVDNSNGGRRYFDAPEVDGFVYIKNNKIKNTGKIKKVKIQQTLEYDLVGSIP